MSKHKKLLSINFVIKAKRDMSNKAIFETDRNTMVYETNEGNKLNIDFESLVYRCIEIFCLYCEAFIKALKIVRGPTIS